MAFDIHVVVRDFPTAIFSHKSVFTSAARLANFAESRSYRQRLFTAPKKTMFVVYKYICDHTTYNTD